ncbi:carbohydrate sulfotransferase 12-like [Hoplias malabaricus]|uniref:carbohydrate sulfotransferase 12-like n=1 Tax=Hoplias malabaricus TaxID=27720 RepID=UPI0034627C5D
MDVSETKFFSPSTVHGTYLQLYSSRPGDQLPSPSGHGSFRYGTLSWGTSGYPMSDEDLESLDVTKLTGQKWLNLQHRQYSRKRLIHDICRHNATFHVLRRPTFDDIPGSQLANLIVDDRRGIIYCYVPKVACTEWKSIMIFLSESLKVNGTPYRNHSEIPRDLIHGNNVIYLNRSHRSMMKWKIKKYKKFLFVRNPFVRLISAYRDKFEKKNDYFYKALAIPIMRRYRFLYPLISAEQAHTAGIRPSFSEFIQYILDLPDEEGDSFEEHWREVHHLCHPCQIEYDFIGKMETMDEDAEHLLRILKVDHIVRFPPGTGNRTEESWIKTWFSTIPIEWRKKLYQIYEADFRLFGYSLPEDFYEEGS